MPFIEETDCKLFVSRRQCQWPRHLQNQNFFLLSLVFPLAIRVAAECWFQIYCGIGW